MGGGGGGKEHSSGPLAPEARGRHSTSTSLALKVTRIVYNPPFEKFLEPPLWVHRLGKETTSPSLYLSQYKEKYNTRQRRGYVNVQDGEEHRTLVNVLHWSMKKNAPGLVSLAWAMSFCKYFKK